MRVVPIRLAPGADLRLALEKVLEEQREQAGWVLSGIGSLSVAPLRLAGQEELTVLEGDLEILTLAGSLSPDGAHLHISVADSQGRVSGGHLAMGATVHTTAEVLVALLPACSFRRELDPRTGFTELIGGPCPATPVLSPGAARRRIAAEVSAGNPSLGWNGA